MLQEIVFGFLFLVSSGLLFNDKFREKKLLVLSTAAIAMLSTYFLAVQMVEYIVDNKLKNASHVQDATNTAMNDAAENAPVAVNNVADNAAAAMERAADNAAAQMVEMADNAAGEPK